MSIKTEQFIKLHKIIEDNFSFFFTCNRDIFWNTVDHLCWGFFVKKKKLTAKSC